LFGVRIREKPVREKRLGYLPKKQLIEEVRKIFPNATVLRNIKSSAYYDRANVEDVSENCEQHANDAVRYGLTRRKVKCWVGRVYGV